jgi:hypothetical protein
LLTGPEGTGECNMIIDAQVASEPDQTIHNPDCVLSKAPLTMR